LTPNLGDSQATVRAEIRGRFKIAVIDQYSVVEITSGNPHRAKSPLSAIPKDGRWLGENQALNQHSCLKH
jgi:hypothetical protein